MRIKLLLLLFDLAPAIALKGIGLDFVILHENNVLTVDVNKLIARFLLFRAESLVLNVLRVTFRAVAIVLADSQEAVRLDSTFSSDFRAPRHL